MNAEQTKTSSKGSKQKNKDSKIGQTDSNNKSYEPQRKKTQNSDDGQPQQKVQDLVHTEPWIVYRSREGLKLIKSFDHDLNEICKEEKILEQIEDIKSNRVESVHCSEDGELVAWCDNRYMKCYHFNSGKIIFNKQNEFKSNCVYISPKSSKLISYSTMSGGDNLHFWELGKYSETLSTDEITNPKHLKSMPFKRASQWKPTFSMNEDICLLHINQELIIYAANKFDKPKQIVGHVKVNDFSLSSASSFDSSYQHLYQKRSKCKTHFIAIYTAGSKGQPSIVKIYKYPNLNDCITNKSFFKADRVKFSWSPSGNSLLLICQADFDQSGKSYYGEQSLNFMNVKGDSYFVKLPKEGTINHIEWFPSCDNDMFVCVYGHQPAKVSLFNNKCEVVFNFGDAGSFNAATFNPFGNILAIYGIGNLAGQLCIWDFDKKKLLTTLKVPETTNLEWCADGLHILTCTTTPRLRVGNGMRLWHYNGSLIYEQVSNDKEQNLELYDVMWQPKPSLYPKPQCNTKPSKYANLLTQSKLSKFQSSAAKYVPPSMRNLNSTKSAFDSAIGVGAGNRLIVGLESLNLASNKTSIKNKKKKNKSKANGTANDDDDKKPEKIG